MGNEDEWDKVRTICKDLLYLAKMNGYEKESFFTSMIILTNLRKSLDSEDNVCMLEEMEKELREEIRRRIGGFS